jgi:glycosyltransferase involved in cell wall biosynthesis
MKKIGYLVPEFPGQTHIFFWREIQALKTMGVQVVLISTRRSNLRLVKHSFAIPASRETHYVFPPKIINVLKTFLINFSWLLKTINYIIKLKEATINEKIKYVGMIPSAADLLYFCIKKKISHVHCHSCGNAAHLLSMVNLSKMVNYSLTLHGDLSVYGKDHFDKMNRAKFIAAVTKPLQEQIAKQVGIEIEKLPIIWMGVDTNRFKLSICKRKKNGSPLRLFTVARLNPAKGHIFALKAIKMLVEKGLKLQYVIAGEGDYRTELEKFVCDLELEKTVRLIGSIDEDAVISEMDKADIVLLTSIGPGEAAPVCIMEAMASGNPVISSIIGGTPDMINHGVDGFLVPQRDEKNIMETIERLAEDTNLRLTIGHAARKTAELRFNHIMQAKKLLKSIERATAQN